jgi:uncharacterized protein (DUF302 family)
MIVAALKAAIGQPDMVEFGKITRSAGSFAELERVVQRGLGRTGLMLFTEFDLGAILRREIGLDTPKIVRLVIGNPLIMKEMVKHVPDAGSYAPVTILADERPDGVHVSYDKMSSLLGPYGNPEALAVARAGECFACRPTYAKSPEAPTIRATLFHGPSVRSGNRRFSPQRTFETRCASRPVCRAECAA